MNETSSNDNKILTTFGKMWSDSLLSQQPNGTYLEAWNAVIDSDSETKYGISNEPSNELFVSLPGDVRGMIYVEERDQYIVFLDTGGGGEIGIVYEKGKYYKKITTTGISSKLGICQDEWIDCDVKIMQPCNQLYLYWSSGNVYKRINLDDPCCNFEEVELIHPVCVSAVRGDVIDYGGSLPNGVYQFAAKARDIEGNDSNWSRISNAISIADGEFKSGEQSRKAISLKINVGNNRDYHIVDLAVISTVAGVTSVEVFASASVSSGSNIINYIYTGKTGREFAINVSDILTRTNRYIKGKNLIQYDNRLILYNLVPIHNLDYQRQANKITAKYVNYIVPLEYAHTFKGLRPNENYWFGIRWNYIDGTHSNDYVIPGLAGGGEPCDGYMDTSSRLNTYIKTIPVDDNFSIDDEVPHDAVKLEDDESTSISDDELGDPNNIELIREIDEYVRDIKTKSINYDEALDCLCEKLADIKGREIRGAFPPIPADSPFFSPPGYWQLEDDVIGAVTLESLLCMCENRGILIDGGNTDSKPVNQYTEDDNAIQGNSLRASSGVGKTHNTGQDNDDRPGVSVGATCNMDEGFVTCSTNICYICKDGVWKTLINGDIYPRNPGYTQERGDNGGIEDTNINSLRMDLGGKDKDKDKENDKDKLSFEYEYSEDGCTIIGVKPLRYTDGLFGSKETQEKYPETEDCNCNKIYGELAGKNVRLHQVPSVSKEPHLLSFSSGVPNKFNMANSEFRKTFVCLIGAEFDNITPPKNLPKPLCPHNPYSITYVQRTEDNKTVVGTGIGHSCFLGRVGGTYYAFPKHSVNSFERFDRHIEPGGGNTFRGGQSINVGAYTVHSADFHMRKPVLDATECLIELEMYGKGWRHGMFAQGEKPETPSQDRINQKGTRQSCNLNHYTQFGHPIVRKVKAMSKAPSDTVVNKSNKFSYDLSNLDRESSVYIELDGGVEKFKKDAAGVYGGADSFGDGASDNSFTGDTFCESLPIHNARAHLMTFIRKRPSQYGSPINQVYIPLGLEAKGFQTKISGLVGDSFVGAMSYKRFGLVSDKTNRVISKFVARDGFAGYGVISRVLGNLMASMWRSLGLRNGGYIPMTQDPTDHIRVFGGLRFIHDIVQNGKVSNPGETKEGQVPPPMKDHAKKKRSGEKDDINYGDNYFPQNLKTLVTTFLNADVNLNYRIHSSKDDGELYYSDNSGTLKGLKIDSSMPEDSRWDNGWLNRWYSEWRENAKWKLIVQGVLTFLFTYGIGIYLIIRGIGMVVDSFSVMGGGTYGMRTSGGVIALIFAIVVLLLGYIWIKFWANSDADNKIIEEYVGLKNIRPDRRNADGSYSFNENRLRQFEDNFWRCDNTHSQVNNWEVSYGMSDPYVTCICPNEYHNKIVYSNKQIADSPIDFWRNYKPNDSLEVNTEHGQIQKIFRIGEALYAHTTDMIIKLNGGGSGLKLDNTTALLGTGDLFGSSSPIYGGVVEGYGGLSDPNSAEVTAYGYIFPDRKARKWYIFTGGLPKALSDNGLKSFMENNMGLILLEKFPSFKLVDIKLQCGVGYSFGIDHAKNRLLITKVDYEPIYNDININKDGLTFNRNGENVSLFDRRYFNNRSFTLSYSLVDNSWISFHNYTPELYAWNRFDMYSFTSNGMWRHNAKGSFQTFYGNYYPFSVEYIVNEKQAADSFKYISTVLGTEAYKWKEYDYINTATTFNEAIFYNSYQMSGLKEFVDTDTLSQTERSTEYSDKVKLNYKNRIWSFKDVVDNTISPDEFLFEPTIGISPRAVNNSNLNSSINNNIFYDNYFANRLIFNKFADVKILLKRVETHIRYVSR